MPRLLDLQCTPLRITIRNNIFPIGHHTFQGILKATFCDLCKTINNDDPFPNLMTASRRLDHFPFGVIEIIMVSALLFIF